MSESTPSEPQDAVLFAVINQIGIVTLNRPKVLNALSHEMLLALEQQLLIWAEDAYIHAVILRGAGEKAFCAGGDIRALYQSWQQQGSLHQTFFVDEYRLDYLIHRYPKPVVALMDGIVMGGGMGLAQGASLRLVTVRTRLAMPETGIGLMPDVGASYFLARTQSKLALYLGITGQTIYAADALLCDLADGYVNSASLTDLPNTLTTINWQDANTAADPQASLHHALEVQALAPEAAPLLTILSALIRHFSAPDIASIMHSLASETDPATLDWAAATLKTMRTRSPLMMTITLHLLSLGRRMDLADCFRMELALGHHSFASGDIIEGVRALIIDKDNTPRWKFTSPEAVPTELVQQFFSAPWSKQQHPLRMLGRS